MKRILYILAILFSLSIHAQIMPPIPFGQVQAATTCTVCSTWDPAKQGGSVTLSGGDLVVNVPVGLSRCGISTVGETSGKWYWEIVWSTGVTYGFVGIALSTVNLNQFLGGNNAGWGYYYTGDRWHTPPGLQGYGTGFTDGEVVGVALDMDNGAVYFRNSSGWVGGGIPWSGSAKIGAAYSTGLSGNTIYAAWGIGDSNAQPGIQVSANFGASPFTYSVPYGYNAGLF